MWSDSRTNREKIVVLYYYRSIKKRKGKRIRETHQHFLQEAKIGFFLLLEVVDEVGETLHIRWDIVLLHQVIPHGSGFTDVLTDLHQPAHHLSPTREWRYGRGFWISK